jgi:hypothetical protein
MQKLVWKVQPAPVGPYRSFQKRGWPSAYYGSTNGKPAAFLHSSNEYSPARVKTGNHTEISIQLCCHQDPDAGKSWKVYTFNKKAKTLDEAKKMVQEFLEKKPIFWPKENQA